MAKVKCIDACRHAGANALGKAPEVIGKAFDPNYLVGAARKVTVFVHFVKNVVDDQV